MTKAKMNKTPTGRMHSKYPSRKNHIWDEIENNEKQRIADILKESVSTWFEDITQEHKDKLKDVPIRRKNLKEMSENAAIDIMKELGLM